MIGDNWDRIVQLLEQIADNTGGRRGTGAGAATGPDQTMIDPVQFHVAETPHLDEDDHDVNADGTVTLEPGEPTTVVEFDRKNGFELLAIGAVNQQDVFYRLQADHDVFLGGDWRTVPLGSLINPYSFVDQAGGPVDLDQKIELEAMLPESADSTVDVSGKAIIRL